MRILFLTLVFAMIITIPSVFAEENVPSWIKNTSGWWANSLITDNEFTNALEFLINEEIIKIDATAGKKSGDIPDWIRNTSGWWANDQISETEFLNAIKFLIEAGIINMSHYSCNENEDKNRNNIPDYIEEIPVLTGLSGYDLGNIKIDIENKNWSNCYFPKDLSHYTFKNSDLTNADFTDSKLFNTMFDNTNLQDADFSNTNLQGSVFYSSNLSRTNFENTDFSTDNWEEPFLKFTYEIHKDRFDQNFDPLITVTNSCYYDPCMHHQLYDSVFDNKFHDMTFGKNMTPLNITLIDIITDKSDNRTIWRHHTLFIDSNITETIFTKSDLTYAEFRELDINNVDFTDTKFFNTKFRYVNFNHVKSVDDILNGTISSDGLVYSPNMESGKTVQDVYDKKFTTLDDIISNNFNMVFHHAFDYPPINWSMGMTIYDKKLYVVDTDNHRIIVFDLETNEELFKFASPIQNYCLRSEVCELENRNLPTSIKIIEEKIFVAYGFQDEIQVFDLDGMYLWKFGSSGTQVGQFNVPHRIATSNNELFVADSENHRIQVFDLNGNFLRQFGNYADSIGYLSHPIDVHVYDNEIFVADDVKKSILVFDLNGKFTREFKVGQNTPDISQPYGVFVYDNLIFVSDVGNFSIKVFDLDGNFVKKFGQHGDHYGEFKYPLYTITDGKRIIVSDAYNYRIQIFNITE